MIGIYLAGGIKYVGWKTVVLVLLTDYCHF